VAICTNNEGVPITFLLGDNGLVVVASLQLRFRFQLHRNSLHIDEECVIIQYEISLIQLVSSWSVMEKLSIGYVDLRDIDCMV
jgi:hypothetical protein